MKKFNPKKKLPETIYGFWQNDSNDGDDDETFFNSGSNPDDLVEANDCRRVGVYKLVGNAEIKNTTTTSNVTAIRQIT